VKSKPSADFHAGKPTSLVDDFEAEGAGLRETLRIEPWHRLSRTTNFLRPKTVTVLGGPTGKGKSLFLLEALLHLHYQGVVWNLLPLEDTAADVYRRLLAFLAADWAMMDTDAAGATRRGEVTALHIRVMAALSGQVWENPRLPVGEVGKRVVPPLPYGEVLDWIEGAVTRARVVAVDPLAQIDWTGAKPWEAQADFIRRVVGLAADTSSTVILIAHSAKRPGKASAETLTAEDIQGAAEITRLAQCVLLWNGHADKASNVWKSGGLTEPVTHNRTMVIGKARNGSGGGSALAFNTREDGPGYDELGVIAPKKNKD
jgi:hypothetical protein